VDFHDLFTGAGLAHGRWDPERGASTVGGPARPEDYAAHLEGKFGLGLVPVREDGTCRFGAIDVDQDTIDHAQVVAHVVRRRLPLSVCRSKSGGAHLYIFMREPGLAAGPLREHLERWAGLLGFPKSEIFPKQVQVNKKNLGNWINLPYFGGGRTTRYAVGADGRALTLAQFLDGVVFFDSGTYKGDESADIGDQAELPPCLRRISADGIQEGTRNQALFNFGVFFRKSDPGGWQDRLVQLNLVAAKPPLGFREISAITKSLSQARYQYQCEQSPIRELCDRLACLKLRYGVAHRPWEETEQYDQIAVTNLRKVLTDPPRYILEVNGQDVGLSLDEFMTFSSLRKRLMAVRDLVVRPMKQLKWDATIKELLSKRQDIEAPPDASVDGQILEALAGFLEYKDKAKSREDLLRGLPFAVGDRLLFRLPDFQRYLQARRLDKLTPSEMFSLLRSLGVQHHHISICGKKFFVWSVPVEAVSLQSEDFTETEDKTPKPEEEV
jgi:hypothetical protein